MNDRMNRRDNAFEAGRFWAIKASWADLEDFALDKHIALPFPETYTLDEQHAFHRGAKAIYDQVNRKETNP
jgi:hypothetical protein